jgi:hypothetical protein
MLLELFNPIQAKELPLSSSVKISASLNKKQDKKQGNITGISSSSIQVDQQPETWITNE